MAFPSTALPVVGQWYINGAWTSFAAGDVFGGDRAEVTITQGRTDETRDVDAARCAFELRNTDGQYSPRNPSGAFYGLFGRNTPVRFGVTSDGAWLQVEGPDHGSIGSTPTAGARVTAPDSAGLSVTGDLDLRFDADLTVWQPASNEAVDLVGKWTSTAGQKGYQLVLLPAGELGLYWSADGTAELGLTSTVPVPVACGRLAVRATLDVNNGAAGHTVTFYTSDSIAGTWTQLGDAVTGSGVTSINNGNAVATVGDTQTGSQAMVVRGRIYAAKILNGIGGTEVGNPDFTAQTAGASSFADAAGNTWTLTGAVELQDLDLAFTGEVPRWAPMRDTTGNDEWVPIDAAGVLQRLSQGDAPLDSAMRRGVLALDTVRAYWPLEDGSGATSFAFGLPTGRRMTWIGDPSLSADDRFVCSAPLPGLNGARYSGTVAPYTDTGEVTAQFLLNAPAGSTDDAVILYLITTQSQWLVRYRTGTSGSLQLEWYDFDGTFVDQSAVINFGVDDTPIWFQLDLTENGADVDWTMSTLEPSATVGLTSSGTGLGLGLGIVTQVRINPFGSLTSTDAIVGHIVIRDDIPSLFDLASQLDAYSGEAAGDRIKRLCLENGVQFTAYGDISNTEAMGPQGRASLLTLLREAADADLGILHEPPDRDGLAYRTRWALETQPAALTLDYTAHDPSAFVPTEDDVALVNDVEVTRGSSGISATGSSERAVQESGPLSIEDPPDGVGAGYSAAVTVNVESDAQLTDQAGWRLHLGTVDEPRVASLAVRLERTSAFATDTARAAVRALRVGDMVTVENPPTGLGSPDDVRQLLQGWTLTLHQFSHRYDFRCSPASPYDVGVWDDAVAPLALYTSSGTVTTEALDTTETGVDVSSPDEKHGLGWSDSDGDFDILIGGERMTVTAISGTGAAQTFTVTRSVNGVVASHASGATVELFDVAYWGL